MNMNVIKGMAFAAGLLGVTLVAGCGGGGNSASGTINTGTPSPHVFVQIDRLSRPAINEVFATVANNRHAVNHTLNSPVDDARRDRTDQRHPELHDRHGRVARRPSPPSSRRSSSRM